MKGQVISGVILNQSDKKPVAYAIVLIKGTQKSVTADENGYFKIQVKSLPINLVIYQFGFFTAEINIKDKTELIIELKQKAFSLEEIIVTAKKVDTIQKKNNSVFLAFEFYDNFIVALVNKGKVYNHLQVLNEDGSIVTEKRAPDGVETMFVDCFGNIQLLSKLSSYQFFYDYEKIVYQEKIPIHDFYSKIEPCQCVFGNFAYFKEVYHKQLKNRYFFISRNKKEDKKIIAEICDQDKVRMFDDMFDLNYFLAKRRHGFMEMTSVDELKKHLNELREDVELNSNQLSLMSPVRSELIKRDSFLIIIDYTNKAINKYTFLGTMIKKDTIKLDKLVSKAVIDPDRNKFYLVTENKGITSLYEWKGSDDCKKSSIEQFTFIKNLRCKNGAFYFLYRDPLEKSNMKIHVYKN